MKNKSWITFLSGALLGAGLTWLFTSKEGKAWIQKMKTGGEDLKDQLLKDIDGLKEKLDKNKSNT